MRTHHRIQQAAVILKKAAHSCQIPIATKMRCTTEHVNTTLIQAATGAELNITQARIEHTSSQERLIDNTCFGLVCNPGHCCINSTSYLLQLQHGGRLYTAAIRFKVPHHRTQYDTRDGTALSDAFLNAPPQYKRLSSFFFSRQHYDPVLHITHAHPSIDYTAPRGTPLRFILSAQVSSYFVSIKEGMAKL